MKEPYEEPDTYLLTEKPTRHCMTDEDVLVEMSYYDFLPFDDLPSWLKAEIRGRVLFVPTRSPTAREMRETEEDHFQHRVHQKELTLDDYLAHFRGTRKIK